jgi:hypothetical protein
VRILLDENLPHELRTQLPGHDVFTVQYMGWAGIKNGRLLAHADGSGFDAIVVVNARSNKPSELVLFVPHLQIALNHLKPKSVIYVSLDPQQ